MPFQGIKLKHPTKSAAEQLGILFQRARDLQSLLDDAYNSPLLLRDCIVNAVKSQPFYELLSTTATPEESNNLHKRLHQCIRQQETASISISKTLDSAVYLFDDENEEDIAQIELHFSQNGKTFFRRRIMRGSSFSTPEYCRQSGNFQNRNRQTDYQRFTKGLFHSRVRSATVKNQIDSSREGMLYYSYNSWFHLYRQFPDFQDSQNSFLQIATTNMINTHMMKQPFHRQHLSLDALLMCTVTALLL